MKKITLRYGAIMMAIVFSIGCNDSDKKSETTAKDTTPVADTGRICLSETVNAYCAFYKISEPKILDTVIGPVMHSEKRSDGNIYQTEHAILAYGRYRTMVLNGYFLKNDAYTLKDASSLFYRELFKTVKPQTEDTFTTTSDGAHIAFRGLTYVAYMPSKDTIRYSYLEDAGAEACASLVPGSNYAFTPEHEQTARLMLLMITAGYFSAQDLIEYQKGNDVRGLVSKILNEERKDVGNDDIGSVLDVFEKVIKGAEDSESGFADINDLRSAPEETQQCGEE